MVKKGIIFIGGALLIYLPFFLTHYQLYIAIMIIIMSLFALSFNVLLGYLGLVPFGHGAFFGISAYAYALLTMKTKLPFLVCAALSPLTSLVLALVVGYFCVRLTGIHFAMLSLAFGQIIYTIVFEWYNFTGGDDGLVGYYVPHLLTNRVVFYYVALAVASGSTFFIWRLVNSPIGYRSKAIKGNELRASFVGINVWKQRLLFCTISGFFAGVAGLLFALFSIQIFPTYLSVTQTMKVFMMCLLGGYTTFIGPIIGAFMEVLIETWITMYTVYWMIILGGVFVIIVLFFPEGICGMLARKVYGDSENRES
jgi:branched-chain amino acid transport system permease protein